MYLKFMKDLGIGDHVHFVRPKVIARRELVLIARLNYIGSAVSTRVTELTELGTSFITFNAQNRRLIGVLR
jgi:hypothetical protein